MTLRAKNGADDNWELGKRYQEDLMNKRGQHIVNI